MTRHKRFVYFHSPGQVLLGKIQLANQTEISLA